MPIRPENRSLYPSDWPEISRRIRQDRAKGCCECCGALNGHPHLITGATVVLTVAHLDHDPSNCAPGNLLALCQKCHNSYDAPSRRAGIRERREKASGQLKLVL